MYINLIVTYALILSKNWKKDDCDGKQSQLDDNLSNLFILSASRIRKKPIYCRK